MKFYLSLTFIFCGLLFFSQESLEPLRTNFKLFDNDISNRSQLVQDLDFIYLTDTINLPIIDDFSTNKFKSYSTECQILFHICQTQHSQIFTIV